MKKSDLKRLIKEILLEMGDETTDPNVTGHSGFKPLKMEYRPYKCSVCGNVQSLNTTHLGPVLAYCDKCSWKRDFAGKEHSHYIPALGSHTYRIFTYAPSVDEDFTLGYSHGIVIDDPTFLTRDPLNDPEMTGKIDEEKYRFDDFHWLANMAGFHKPTDVYYGTVLIGTIESTPRGDGYVVISVQGPKGTTPIKPSKQNHFKTKNDAAKVLHQTWKLLRHDAQG